MTNKTLIALATAWGPKHGGINSFNRDLLRAFGVAYRESVRVVCLVPMADEAARREAGGDSVELRTLRNPPGGERLEAAHAAEIVECLRDVITPETVWLGHDSFTGAAAVEAARQTGTKSAVIHHMSYAAYKGFQSGSSQKAQDKSREQHEIFSKADHRLAVGPLLRDALEDLTDAEDVHMLIPGLPEIDPKTPPNRWTVLLFGRLDPESDRIKQGRLGVAAFAATYKDALSQPVLSPALRERPRLKLYGIEPAEEAELREFAGQQAGAALDFHALPFLEDRKALFDDLAKASVALMPSWHEGFGLTGWEAIGAGVPLIMSRQSGLHRFLQDEMAGAGTTYAVDIRGKEADTPYQEEDVTALANAIKQVAANKEAARRTALRLREMLSDRTWAKCAETLADALAWPLSDRTVEEALPLPTAPTASPPPLGGLLYQPQPQWQPGIGYSDSMLLRAEEASVPFHSGRDKTLNTLLVWATETSNYPLALRLLIGPGGIGKTRLLIEACQRLPDGWQYGFLESAVTPGDIKRLLPTWLQAHENTLMVVDYAETRSDQLVALVEAAHAHNKTHVSTRLRVVLLARAAGDWWDQLPSRNAICEAVFNGYATSGPYPLPPLHADIEDRAAAFDSAWKAFADKLQHDSPAPPRPDLAAEHFASPLYLQMAALMALRGERADTARGLLDAVLRHEGHYWRRLGETLGLADTERPAQHLLSLATLAGGIATPREARELYQTSGGPTLGKPDLEKLFIALCPLYPGRQGLQPVRPDLLGESLVARSLTLATDHDISLLNGLLSGRASEAVRRHTLTVLTRLAQHRPEMETLLSDTLGRHFPGLASVIVAAGLETGEPLPTAAIAALDRLKPNECRQVVGLLERSLPDPTVKLAGLALKVAEYRERFAGLAYKQKPNREHVGSYVNALNRLGNRQAQLGKYEEARASFEAALLLANRLPREFPQDTAGLSLNLSNVLSDLGRLDEALAMARAAVKAVDSLAKIGRGSHEPDLAMSLNQLANCLSDLGQHDEALIHAQRSLSVYQRLATAEPNRFAPDLAMSLNNLGNRLGELGRHEETLKCYQRAVDILERFAAEFPDRFDPNLALYRSNLGAHLSELGRRDEAVQYAQQALVIQELLAAAHPDRFEHDLAVFLGNLGSHLCGLGNYEEAWNRESAALNIYRRLASLYPKRHSADLLRALYDLAQLAWVRNLPEIDHPDEQEVEDLLANVTLHLRPALQASGAFTLACIARETDPVRCLELMEQAESLYESLPVAQRRSLQEMHVVAAAYLAQYAATPQRQQVAQEAYRAFAAPRNGRLPRMLLDTLGRLGCTRDPY